ncbi:hypothetical protein HDV06_001150 [Boothiomyces sp. JEL0866]|nr:hypothetical protein HDV06_001150 [Boothiomyces sp. JEL0866]
MKKSNLDFLSTKLMVFVPILLYLIDARCISLKNSRLCPQYKDYSVNIPMNSTEKIQFTNLAGFDAYVSRNQVFNMESVCPTWPSIGNDPIPYPVSFSCAYYISISPTCNTNPLSPVLCQQTIATTLLYLKNQYLIPKQCNMDEYNQLFGQFQTFLNQAPTSNCANGFGNELSAPCLPSAQLSNNFCNLVNNQPVCCTKSIPKFKPPLAIGNPKSSTLNPPAPGPTPNPVQTDPSNANINTVANLNVITTGSQSPTGVPGKADLATGTRPIVETAGNGLQVAGIPTGIVLTAAPDIPDIVNDPQPTLQNTSPSSSTGHPLVIGFSIIGLCFLIVLAVIYGIVVHQRKEHNDTNSEINLPKEILPVLYEYIPTMDDELYLGKIVFDLATGDFIEIEVKYDDGWARGLNLTTKEVGVFPLAHIGTYSLLMPHFNLYSDVKSFDAYVLGNAVFNMNSQVCPKWPVVGNQPVSYATSFACGYAMFNSYQPCNSGLPPPPALCQDTVNTALGYLQNTVFQQKGCSLTQFNMPQFFQSYSAFQAGAPSTGCVRAFGADAQAPCGFTGANAQTLSTAYCNEQKNAPLCCNPNSPLTIQANAATVVSSAPSPAPVAGSDTGGSGTVGNSTGVNGAAVVTPQSSATSATQNSSTSSSSVLSPLVIGGAAFGLALIAVFGAMLFIASRKKSSTAPNTSKSSNVPPAAPISGGQPQEETLECVFEYQANLFDELTLEVGDHVVIREKFDDGWGIGFNLNSQKEGTFPLACVGPIGSYDPNRMTMATDSQYATDSMYQQYPNQPRYEEGRPESMYSKRTSSIYGANQHQQGYPNYQNYN